jgi:hypothetical protein
VHRPGPLLRRVENERVKQVKAVIDNLKSFQDWNAATKATPINEEFGADEDQLLEFEMVRATRLINNRNRGPVTMTISLNSNRKSRVNAEHPDLYTLLSPDVIIEEDISIENHSTIDCFKRYRDVVYRNMSSTCVILN